MNSWQFHPLSLEKQSQRDALIRVLVRVMRAIAQRRLVSYDDYACEQYVEHRVARAGPGCYEYPTERVEYADLDWLRDHPTGTLRLECIVRVEDRDRIDGDGICTDGQILEDLFGAEVAAWRAAWEKEQRQAQKKRKPQKHRATPKTKVKQAPQRQRKPLPMPVQQGCLFDW